MRENRTYGSEGGEAKAFPTPISGSRDETSQFGNPAAATAPPQILIAAWRPGWSRSRPRQDHLAHFRTMDARYRRLLCRKACGITASTPSFPGSEP